ncbi:hypothetical protein ASG40_19970 [Methylobacterium sp. Leaf399]|uniref:hypothetical protein n=1 Tax=unclassified Methylobacterium TaxID=2615210 RepID=UPI0006FDA732|nr:MULTISPECIES: hypothetical protein [unclassified Methylobacterium]KQT12570.1 hypothetical protein ASG40_19970 [Methylobacterium sp. Leaf399]KQT86598.1 hypothetical protein ASG59_17040 [Methylobacterium sp. Leaf466]
MGSENASASPARDGMIALAIAAVVLASVLLSHLAPAATRPHAVSPATDESCAEWGDGCRVCQRGAEGVACSMPGIACVTGQTACLRRVGG